MTWDAYNRRKNLLREILAIADRDRSEGRTAELTDLIDTVDPQRAVFADDAAALYEIQMTWFQRLSGLIDQLAAEGAQSPETVALEAWVQAAAELPGARALLDAHLGHPALAKAFATERSFLAFAAGAAHRQPAADSQGGRIIAEARATAERRPVAVPDVVDHERPSLIARLRSVIAA